MTFDPSQSQPLMASKPAWDRDFSTLATAVRFAAKYFRNRTSVRFVISLGHGNGKWYVFPHNSLRFFEFKCPRGRSTAMFSGTYYDLTTLARSFPPDLFSSLPIFENHET